MLLCTQFDIHLLIQQLMMQLMIIRIIFQHSMTQKMIQIIEGEF
jgi:hypothetical protein